MLNPQRLAVLRQFAAQGTIAGAADALAFTPSAVSQQLSQLQREAGVELFRKVGRRLELTDAGRMLVTRAGELLERVEEVEAELAAHAEQVRGTVRVGAFQTAAAALAMPAIDRLALEYPSLRLELYEVEAEESLPLVARGGLDVVIAEEYEHAPRPRTPGLERVYLEPDTMLIALPRGDAEGAVSLAALQDRPWACARAGTAYADMFDRLCRSVGGFEPDVRHRVNDLELLLSLVAGGRAAAIVPVLGRPERDGVGIHPIAEGRFTRALFVATRASDRARPSTAAVVAALSEDDRR